MKILLCCLCCLGQLLCAAQSPPRYSILITELLPDPSPSAGLPEGEFVEITNATDFSVTLSRWKLTDGQSVATIPDGTVLEPDSSLVLCSRNNQVLYARYGKCIGLSGFPSLDNAGDQLQLITAAGTLMHAVSYHADSYGNPLKAAGGWSLEMADTRWPCLQGPNWRASIHPDGGTPGRPNSLPPIPPDTMTPFPVRTYSPDSATVMVHFSETLDSMTASAHTCYELDQGIGMPVRAEPQPPFFNEVRLTLAKSLSPRKVYTLRVAGVRDCTGNTMTVPVVVKAAIPLPPAAGSALINELLFNPPSEGADFLELYNHSDQTIDLGEIFIGSRNAAGQVISLVKCSASPWNFYPGEYIVLSEDSSWVQRYYAGTLAAALIQRSPLPSWPDNNGVVIIADRQGNTLDEFAYEDDFHFPLLGNREGVTLERISPASPASAKSNWHSAATASGHGTPTRENTQHRDEPEIGTGMTFTPAVFSPDLDGFDDFLRIDYHFQSPGVVCSLSIFDAGGNLVRMLVQNQLCGISGSFTWDGMDQNARPVAPGIYHVFTNLFLVSGFRKTTRHSVAVVYRR